jgi:hypothetical protein
VERAFGWDTSPSVNWARAANVPASRIAATTTDVIDDFISVLSFPPLLGKRRIEFGERKSVLNARCQHRAHHGIEKPSRLFGRL